MKRFFVILICSFFVSLPAIGFAQWSVGPHLVISIPQTDFANVSEVGGGFGIKGIYDLGFDWFAVRGDFAFISHGREFQTVFDSGGNAFPADVRNESIRLALGPSLSTGGRDLRLYVTALGGFYLFRTSTNITTIFGNVLADSQTDAAVGWSAGGGIQYDIGLGPWVDASIEYLTVYNITTEFEVEGETIKEDITANEITLKIGVTWFLD